jgi:hypothetical protein
MIIFKARSLIAESGCKGSDLFLFQEDGNNFTLGRL